MLVATSASARGDRAGVGPEETLQYILASDSTQSPQQQRQGGSMPAGGKVTGGHCGP